MGSELGGGPLPDGVEQGQLSGSPDERRRGRGPLGRGSDRLQREPRLDGVPLPLRGDGFELSIADHVPRGPIRLLADHEPPGRRRRLEPRGGVHDVAQREGLAGLRTRPQGHDRVARVHRRPDLERSVGALPAQIADRVHDAQAGADRALGVIAVRDRSAEHGHDRVADELLDRAPESLDLLLRSRVEALEEVADLFRIGPVGLGREPDQVDEQHRDELALLASAFGP